MYNLVQAYIILFLNLDNGISTYDFIYFGSMQINCHVPQ